MSDNEPKDLLNENGDVLPVPAPDFLKPKTLKKRAPSWKKWLFYIFLFLLVVFITNYGLKAYALIKWSGRFTSIDPVTLQPRKTGLLETIRGFFGGADAFPQQDQSRINILILGIGGPGHDGPFLSDTNIILSVMPGQKKAALISVPRDLSVKIDGYGYRKINSANAFGEVKAPGAGGEFARQIFSQAFNMDIPYYVRVDFKAFEDLVGAVGGVDIVVPRTFTDYSYPTDNFGYQTVSFTAGPEHMDGSRALIFARSRHGNNGEGSDFARSHRQQLVISALKEKMLSAGTYLNPVTTQKIIDSLTAHIATNLNFAQIMQLADIAKNINKDEIKTLVLDDSPGGFLKNFIGEDGAFLLVPRSGTFDEIDNAIANVFESTSTPGLAIASSTPAVAPSKPMPTLPPAKIAIQNGTWKVGYAARIKSELGEKGFNIISIGNSRVRPVSSTAIYVLNQKVNNEVLSSLSNEMSAIPTTTLPQWMTVTSTATPDIIILLGLQN